jgi:hypothetical protein
LQSQLKERINGGAGYKGRLAYGNIIWEEELREMTISSAQGKNHEWVSHENASLVG